MDARQWLGRGRTIDRQIDALLEAKRVARERAESITQNYSEDGAQSTKDPHKYDRLVELENLIEQKEEELNATKAEIIETVWKLKDGRQRTVLLHYYVNILSLEQTAVKMHYSYENVKYLRRKAIGNMTKILEEAGLT